MLSSCKYLVPLLGALLISQIHCQGEVKDILPIPTTVGPDTTTPAATTTTTKATTTPATTPPPTTTPAPATTTTPSAPTTPAPAQVGTWNVTDATTNITCVMLTMSMQVSVQYPTSDNKTSTAIVTVPVEGTTVSGKCDNLTQSISISWSPAAKQTDKLDVEFSLNTTSKSYHVTKLSVTVDPTSFPGSTAKGVMVLDVTSENLPSAPLAMSYRCTPDEVFNLTGNSMLTIKDLQLQAFHSASDNKFGAASDCQAGDTADIVPIVVGCALAGLVLIVLVAYLVGRRRSRQSGYLSM